MVLECPEEGGIDGNAVRRRYSTIRREEESNSLATITKEWLSLRVSGSSVPNLSRNSASSELPSLPQAIPSI